MPRPPCSLRQLLRGASYELLPAACRDVHSLQPRPPPGTRVYIPHLNGASAADAAEAAGQLRRHGLWPIPHLCARRLRDKAELEMTVARMAQNGVEEVLLVAGSVDPPMGSFSESLELLESGVLQDHGIRSVGIAGHPQGNPSVPHLSDADLVAAVARKADAALRAGLKVHIATQFCFDLNAVVAYTDQLARAGIALPVVVGVVGCCSWKTCLQYARLCDVGITPQLVAQNHQLLFYRPEHLLEPLARHMADNPSSNIVGVHFYPFGALSQTLHWAEDAIALDK